MGYLWLPAIFVAFFGSMLLVLQPRLDYRWKLAGIVALAVPGWVWFVVFMQRMSPYCREDDECSLGGLVVFFAASSVTIAVIVGSLLGVALFRRW